MEKWQDLNDEFAANSTSFFIKKIRRGNGGRGRGSWDIIYKYTLFTVMAY